MRSLGMVALTFTLGLVACTPGEPPGAVEPASPARDAASAPSAPAPAAPADRAQPANDASPPVEVDAAAPEETLEASDATEPQTEAKPDPNDALTTARAQALFEAIASDRIERAMPFFFPLDAYKQVKDSSNPESDWKHRLIAAYTRDLHELHRARPDLAKARFVRLTYPEAATRWVKPGEEYNKLGYYRVFGSKLVYAREDGSEREIPIKSLISWRGKFYVVHFSSFK